MQYLKSYLTEQINTYVFEYFDNISQEQITTQLTKGQIQLNNLQFKPSIFKKLNLPLIIKESKINYVNVALGKQPTIKIDNFYIVIEILNLQRDFIMESAIKLQILDKFKDNLVQNLLKAMAVSDNSQQKQDPKKKLAFNLIQNMEVELTNFNITFLDKYCTDNAFGIKLENLTCKSAMNPNKPKLRNIEIKKLQLFWQDPISQLNAYATLEDVAEQNSDCLSFQLGVVFEQLIFKCSKIQCNSMYRFSDYVSQFNRRKNQQVEKNKDNENDEKIKIEIKQILKSIPLQESSNESQDYNKLCQLIQSQSMNELKQLQFEILKYDKGDEIIQMRKKKLGWFGGMLKNDKKMEEKISNLLDVLDQDPNMQQQFLKSLQLKFELVVNQCEISLSSIYRNQLNQLILKLNNVNMQMTKTNELQLDFIIKDAEVLLKYQDQINYLVSKNNKFIDKYSLELHLNDDSKKETLFIQTCPFQIIFNQEAFEKYYDLFYFFVITENQIPKLTQKAKDQIKDIVNDKKEKDIQIKLEKIYIISTNGKETFLFSPGSLDFIYKTQNQLTYFIKISEATFGFSEKVSSCINFINQQYCFNSIIISKDFMEITKCDINLIIQLQNNQIKTILELGDLNFQINPIIYKYFYQFYGTHFQQPLKELRNQLRNNEENQHKLCYFSNNHITNKVRCRLTFQNNFLNIYEAESDQKFMKIDLQNIQFQSYFQDQQYILELQTNNMIVQLDFQKEADRQIVINKCQISRNDDYYLQSILEQNGSNQNNNERKVKILYNYQEYSSVFEFNIKDIFIEVLRDMNLKFVNIHLTDLNLQIQNSKLESNFYLKFNNFEIINSQEQKNEEKNLLKIQNNKNQIILEYQQQLNSISQIKLKLHYCIFSYKSKTISQILEQYPIQLEQDWNITKFIINSYLTYYPDLKIICSDMKIDILMKSIFFKQKQLQQIEFAQEYIQIIFPQDSIDKDCLQINCSPKGILIFNNYKEMNLEITINEAQAIFMKQLSLQTSQLKFQSSKKILLSPCQIKFNWYVVFQTNTIKNSINFYANQLKIALSTKDICYIIRQFNKLSNQITEFYKTHDIASYLIKYRAQTYSIDFQIQTLIQAAFIDDYLSQSLPMFGIILTKPKLRLEINQEDVSFQISNQLSLEYYHSIKLAWEPVIEPIYLVFTLLVSISIPQINLLFVIQETLNTNISIELIKNLLKFKKLVKQFQINQEKQTREQIIENTAQILTYETYEIYNQSGFFIVAQGDQERIELNNQQKKITKGKGLFQFYIDGINSNVKIENWSLNLQKKKVICQKGVTLIIETIVDQFMNSSKTLISSSILLVNLSPFPLQIKFQQQQTIGLDKGDRQQQYQIFQKYSNIYNLPNQEGQFCLVENNQSSQYFNYSDINKNLKKDNTETLNLRNKYFRLKCVLDPIMKERMLISIMAILEFINQTPFSIRIDKHSSQTNQHVNFTLNQNQIVQDCEINPSKEYFFTFYVHRYYQSTHYSINDLTQGCSVVLEGEKWQLINYSQVSGLQLLIKPKIDNYGRHQITIQFRQSYIINNTDLDLIFYQGTEQNQEILDGQKQNTSSQLIVLQNIKEKTVLTFEERNTNIKQQQLILTNIINQETLQIQKKENHLIYYIPLQLEKKFIQLGDQTIPFFELYYKYTIYNRLNYVVQLSYNNEPLILEPFIQTPLIIWNQDIILDPDQPYECTLIIYFDGQQFKTKKFNIMVQQQQMMLLQSFHSKLKQFIKISIVMQKNQFLFIIDDIQELKDYPYMIVNQSQFLKIRLDYDNEKLNHGDQFPLINYNEQYDGCTYQVSLKDEIMSWDNATNFVLQLDQVGLTGILEINGKKYEYALIQENKQKRFIFTDYKILGQNQLQNQVQKIQYVFEIKMHITKCIISYIENLEYECKELVICSLENLVMLYKSNKGNQKLVKFELQTLQIDAQSKKISNEKTILFSMVQSNQNSIEFQLHLDTNEQFNYLVKLVQINFGNFQFCMDQKLYDKLEQVQAQFYELIGQQQSSQSRYNQLQLLENPQQIQDIIQKNKLKQVKIFVQKLNLYPMKMKILFLKDIYQLERQQFIKENFQSTPSDLRSVIQKYVFGDSKFLFNMVAQFLSNKLNINQVKLTNWKEIRIKRALYETTKIYKVYDFKQAQHYQILKDAKKNHKIDQFKWRKCNIISTHEIIQKGQDQILYICDDQIILIEQNQISNYVDYDKIQLVYSNTENLHLYIFYNEEELQLYCKDQINLSIALQNLNRFHNGSHN